MQILALANAIDALEDAVRADALNPSEETQKNLADARIVLQNAILDVRLDDRKQND